MNLSAFRISPQVGFMLEDPLSHLPPYYEAWDQIASNMVTLVEERRVRAVVDQLPMLGIEQLTNTGDGFEIDYRNLRLAHLQLATLMSGYVWSEGDANVPRVLPRQIAVPLWNVCKKLGGVAPIASQTACCLANYQQIRPDLPLRAEDNMRIISMKFISDYGNDWFFLNTAQIELDFAKTIPDMMQGYMASFTESKLTNKTIVLQNSLRSMTAAVKQMTNTLHKMRLHLSPEVFFYGFRPYLAGFTSGPYAKLGGIIYQDCDNNLLQSFAGGSAAQSCTLQCIDSFLGIQHEGQARTFLRDMRNYVPVEHKRFVEIIEDNSKVRETVKASNDSMLREAYNACIDAVLEFRNAHIKIITQYIINARNKIQDNGSHEIIQRQQSLPASFHTLNEMGTGGTGIMPFLKAVRDTTVKHRL